MPKETSLKTIWVAPADIITLGFIAYMTVLSSERISAQEGATGDATPETTITPSPAAPTGKLVVAPQSVERGQTTLAVGFHVEPADLEVKIEYSGHFIPEEESCDAAGTSGKTQNALAPTWITLNACALGDGWTRLVASDTGAVIGTVNVTVVEPTVGGQEGEGQILVRLSGVASSMEVGDSDSFTVSAGRLDSAEDYELYITSLNASGIAFDEDCDDFTKTVDVSGVNTYSGSHTMYACAPPGSYLWAYLQLNGLTVASSGAQANYVTVTEDPPPADTATPTPTPTPTPVSLTVSFASTTRTVDEGDSATFKLRLDRKSDRSLTIPITVSDDDYDEIDVAFGAGDDSKSFTIESLEDDDCDDERLTLGFGTLPSKVSVGNPASARFNIKDVDTCATEPDMVSRPSASPGDETLEVSWSEPDDGGAEIKRYHVQHRDSSSSWPSDYTSVSDRTLDITGLTNGVLYYVRVQACNDVGCGDWSRSTSGVPRTTPGRPAAPSLDTGDRRLFASWSSPDDGGSPLTHFNLRYRRKGASSWEPQVPISTSKGNQVTTYTITGLAVGVEYETQVRARNVAGNGPWSPSGAGFTNRPPEFDDEDNTRKVAENTQSGSPFDDPVAATDDDGDELEYSLEGTDATSFDIDSATGQLKTEDALDYETDNSYSVTVQVKDGNGGSDSIDVTINVTDVNETPEVESQIDDQTLTTGGSTRLDLPDHFDDPDGDALTYTASSSDTGVATVRVEAGALRLTAVSEGSATVTVEAADRPPEDSDRLTVSQSFEVTVEPKPLPRIAVSGDTSIDYAENGTGAVDTYSANRSGVNWSLSGEDDGLFDISGGQLTFKNSPDFEDPKDSGENNVYKVTVRASKSGHITGSLAVVIEVNNVNEAPVGVSIDDQIFEEGVSSLLIDLSSYFRDPDAKDTLTYDASASPTGVVTLSVNGSELTVSRQASGETTVTVTATDMDDLEVSQDFQAVVFPTLDPPTLRLGGEGESLAATFTEPSLTDSFGYELTLLGLRDGETSFTSRADASLTSEEQTSHTFSLARDSGDVFKVQLTVCRKSDANVCESVESANIHRPRPPSGLSVSINPAGSADLEVSYTPSEAPHRYATELHSSASETGTYAFKGSLTSGESFRPTFLNQTRDRWYKARTKNCIDAAHTQCGLWSAFSPALPLPAKLEAPADLDVVPMPLRKARLTWTASANADAHTEYRIEIAAASAPTSFSTLPLGVAHPSTEHVFELDNVLSGKGLANEDYFNIRIMAEDTNTPKLKLDSEDSDTVRIMDNPLLTEGGSARSNSVGEAALRWSNISGAASHTVRYRELGSWFDGQGRSRHEIDHTHLDWPAHQEWPHYDRQFVELPSSSASSKDVSGLDDDKIYAFQVNYMTGGGKKVFSARDAFVWPATDFPDNAARIGTYTFFGHHPNREFEYIICKDTFPDDPTTASVNEREEWARLIENAFMQW